MFISTVNSLALNLELHTDSYQEVHGPGQLLRYLQLPQDVYRVLVLLQVGVQRTKLHMLLNHDI